MICKSKKRCVSFGKSPRGMYKSNTLISNMHCKCHHCILNNSIFSVSITIVINFPMYTCHYLVYYNTDEGRRRCHNMSVTKLKLVVYVLKIFTSLQRNRPFGNLCSPVPFSHTLIFVLTFKFLMPRLETIPSN